MGLQVTSNTIGIVIFSDRNDYASSKLVGERFAPASCKLSTTPEASENIRMVILLFAGRHDCNAQSWRERGLHQRVAS